MSRAATLAPRGAPWFEWLTLASAAAAVIAAALAFKPDWRGLVSAQVAVVRLEGEYRHIDRFRVERIFERLYEQRLMSVDVHEVARALAEIPWVRGAVVRRVWPATLHVRLHEYEPVAYWGRAALLSEDGEVFAPPLGRPYDLPFFEAPPERRHEVLAFYRWLAAAFGDAGAEVAALRLDRRGSWSLRLADGTRLALGRENARARASRFLAARRAGFAPPRRAACIDLRYPDGFAVRTRAPTTPQETTC